METLNDSILEEFTKAQYELVKSERHLILKHREYGDFWVIHECESFDIDIQNEIYDSCKSSLSSYNDADKNTSLLVLLQVKTVDENLKKHIIEIENDPFYFKKYVLVYTLKDWEELKPLLAGKELSDYLMQPSVFESLKKEDSSNAIGKYHLLYSIAHKLPFVMINVEAKDSGDLTNSFVQQNEQDKELYRWLSDIDNPKDIESIEKLLLSEGINNEDI